MSDELAAAFERERPRLRGVAYRMLGSLSDADDAVQEAWLRLARSDSDEVRNLQAWLTTVVGRIALDMLRARRTRREDPLEDAVVSWPDPLLSPPDVLDPDPEQQALLADSVGLALMVVLETLSPAERLAFVLHDMFGVPFAEIGPMLDRSEDAAKMLASRARRRVQGTSQSATDRSRQQEVVAAFQAAAREGDFEALVAVLHPDVEIRSDIGARRTVGAEAAVRQAMAFRRYALAGRSVLVNGAPGILVWPDGAPPYALLAFTVRDGLITRMDVVAAPERLSRLDLSALAT
jgi:RNA polymerase sigma factor (sigma-70 family)